ncbi:Gfo/Idh/MocA family protein [Caproiciproducens sp.]|uniref:Gfo/Idh/MocA family protein n=1 Tax=Caproiciproducens sp. TaxID=1954376 RepID=UPI0028977507|nr:Gfo/Idh/MocA family oxidoreductase [Caproiciproducens sp.]
MNKIKVAIVGNGSICRFHADAYRKLDCVEIVAACDINEERAKQFAEEYGVPRVFTDYREMLKMEEIQAVSVTTWNNAHAEVSIAALKAGKDVLCEKPLSMNAAEAQKMVETAKETGHLLMVGFVRRFGENAQVLKEFIDKGELGNIYYAKVSYIRRWGNPGGWFSDKKRSGGGPLIDLGVHIIDLAYYMGGKPKAVSVFGAAFSHLGMKPELKGVTKYYSADYSEHNDVEDCTVAMVRFDSGMTVFFEASWVQNIKKDELVIQLYGTKGGVQLEPTLEFYETKNNYMVNTTPVLDKASFTMEDGFAKEVGHFVDCVRGQAACINPCEDGLELMKIVDAIYESSKTGHEVVVQ